jgi:hypothetical protein
MLRAFARQMAGSAQQAGMRSMASAAGSKGVTYGGVTIHPPATKHVVLAEIMGGLLWSWLLIRLYEDGHGLFFGHTAHLDHELHELQHGSGKDEH